MQSNMVVLALPINFLVKFTKYDFLNEIRTATIFRPKCVQTNCTLCNVYIPMLNNRNFVHHVSKIVLF